MTGFDDLAGAIARALLFADASAAAIAKLAAGARRRRLSDGEALNVAAKDSRDLSILLNGQVEIGLLCGGRRQVLEVVGPVTVLGIEDLFDVEPGPAKRVRSAHAVGFAEIIETPLALTQEVAREEPDFAPRLLAAYARRVKHLIGLAHDVRLRSASQRLGLFLLCMAEQKRLGARLRFPYEKKLAAATLGIAPETLSRALQQLKPYGVEALEENVVIVSNPQALRDFCRDDAIPGVAKAQDRGPGRRRRPPPLQVSTMSR
jgi:CRP/FNR family transcriptional activator FtrB